MSLPVRSDPDKYNAMLREALYERDDSKILYLVHEGANINLPIENGWRPLHIAAKLGDIKIIRSLVECGANIKLLNKPFSILDDQLYAATDNIFTDNKFQTALQIAQQYQNIEAIDLLSKYENDCPIYAENDISLYCLT